MTIRRNRTRLATFAAVVLAGASLAHASDTSPWADDLRSSVRLVAGSKQGANSLRAGVEIKLQPGWHTYWRYPGDSGVPPRFSFAGSDNLASADVQFPAPHAFTDDAGTTIGYKENVIFPVRVVPQQPGKPVTLRLKLDYAVCEKMCVPAEAKAELTLDGKASENAALASAEARVPKPVSPTAAKISIRRVNGGPKPQVLVDLPASNDLHLFVEGPTPEWALPIPKKADGAPAGRAHFTFDLDGLPPGADAKKPAELTFTIVRGDKATEVKTHLD